MILFYNACLFCAERPLFIRHDVLNKKYCHSLASEGFHTLFMHPVSDFIPCLKWKYESDFEVEIKGHKEFLLLVIELKLELVCKVSN